MGEITSSHFFRVTISTQQLLLRNSCFFRAATFFKELPFSGQLLLRNSHFFRVGTFNSSFSEQNVYRAATS